jgi:hypothetical protein
MNASGKINNIPTRDQYVPIWKARPLEPGEYIVNLMQLGPMRGIFIDGKWCFVSGDRIPDSIILGWK